LYGFTVFAYCVIWPVCAVLTPQRCVLQAGKAHNTGAGFAQESDAHKYVKLSCDRKACDGVQHMWQVLAALKPAVSHGAVGTGQRVTRVPAHPECLQYRDADGNQKRVSRKVSDECVSDEPFTGVLRVGF
jgi:hypothetical protein